MERRKKYDDDGGLVSDRISQLPEPILIHILCFLSLKKALQTTVLSKSWRHLGSNLPVIDLRRTCRDSKYCSHVKLRNISFCENCFVGNTEAFVSVLDNTFQRYHHHQNLFTQEIRLQKLEVDSISVLQKWIPMFINLNTRVNTFRLSFDTPGAYYALPSVVFQAESLREICLHGCRLGGVSSVDINVVWKNLQKLSLTQVLFHDDATLEKIMAGCPLLEYLALINCPGLKTTNIVNKNHYLKHLEFCSCGEEFVEHSIEVDTPTLQSIRIVRCKNWYHNHSNYFPHLKSLHLLYVKLSTESFDNFSGNFPRLEELTLFCCYGFDEFKFSSCSIKRLIMEFTPSIKVVAIDAPNLLYFKFCGWEFPTTFSLTALPRECKSHLALYNSVCANNDVFSRLLVLTEMVKTLSQSQISLELYENLFFKMTQIEWSFNDRPIVVEHLGLNIGKRCPDFLPHFLNALFRIFRPRYTNALHLYDNDDEQVTEFLWKTLVHERKKRAYGWEQHLEEVSIEASDEEGKVWHHVQWTCLPEWSKNQKIRFQLKWRD